MITHRDLFRRFMEEYVRCNRPIAEALDILQEEHLCWYRYLLPTLISVKNKLKTLVGTLEWCDNLVSALMGGINRRFQKVLEVVDEGRVSAVAAAVHPKFKLKWLHCLSASAQGNDFSALKDSLTSGTSPINEDQAMEVSDEADFFEFSSCDDQNTSIVENSTFGVNDREALFQRFLSETRTDMELLNLHPIVKNIFIKFNTPLPSSAPVERLFSYATMFNLPKFNRLNDDNFELRVLMRANVTNRNKK